MKKNTYQKKVTDLRYGDILVLCGLKYDFIKLESIGDGQVKVYYGDPFVKEFILCNTNDNITLLH